MQEKCNGDVVFTSDATIPDIGKVFSGAIELYTPGAMRAVKATGVYILNRDDHRIIGIKGPCPHYKHGECSVGLPCPINSLVNK